MAEAATSDKFAQVRGFQVVIDGAGGKEVDTAWESVSSGELAADLAGGTINADKFQTASPGHKSVGEITLRGAMTDTRAGLATWINETVSGKPWKRNVSITAVLSDGTVSETVTYIDCTISAYKPPRLALPLLDDPCARQAEGGSPVRLPRLGDQGLGTA
jgi:hypothetical protein